MALLMISSEDEGVKVVSYSAGASARAKSTTLTIKVEVSDPWQLSHLMQTLSELHHPAPKPRKKMLALPSPETVAD